MLVKAVNERNVRGVNGMGIYFARYCCYIVSHNMLVHTVRLDVILCIWKEDTTFFFFCFKAKEAGYSQVCPWLKYIFVWNRSFSSKIGGFESSIRQYVWEAGGCPKRRLPLCCLSIGNECTCLKIPAFCTAPSLICAPKHSRSAKTSLAADLLGKAVNGICAWFRFQTPYTHNVHVGPRERSRLMILPRRNVWWNRPGVHFRFTSDLPLQRRLNTM